MNKKTIELYYHQEKEVARKEYKSTQFDFLTLVNAFYIACINGLIADLVITNDDDDDDREYLEYLKNILDTRDTITARDWCRDFGALNRLKDTYLLKGYEFIKGDIKGLYFVNFGGKKYACGLKTLGLIENNKITKVYTRELNNK